MRHSSLGQPMPGTSRRAVLRGLGGAALLGAGIPLLSACGGSGSRPPTRRPSPLGSNASDAVPKKAFAEIYAAFTKQSGITVDVNTKDHNTFQEQINTYLQGTPDDVFHWFAGYRMQFFAAKGLATPIDDVWDRRSAATSPSAMKELSKGEDGKYYFVPLYTYPWAVFYRKSVFQQYGYEVPTTWDQLRRPVQADAEGQARPDRLRRQGRLAGDGHLRPDQLPHQRLRLPRRADGGQGLLDRRQGPQGLRPLGRDCCPTTRRAPSAVPGRTPRRPWWRRRRACTCWAPSWASSSPTRPTWTTSTSSPSRRSTRRTARTPSRRRPTASCSARPRRTRPAPSSCWSSSARPRPSRSTSRPTRASSPPPPRPTPPRTSPLQKKAYEMISGAKSLTQFMDRDSRPDFTSTVMQPALQKFIRDPKGVDSLLSSIERQKKTIFASWLSRPPLTDEHRTMTPKRPPRSRRRPRAASGRRVPPPRRRSRRATGACSPAVTGSRWA